MDGINALVQNSEDVTKYDDKHKNGQSKMTKTL